MNDRTSVFEPPTDISLCISRHLTRLTILIAVEVRADVGRSGWANMSGPNEPNEMVVPGATSFQSALTSRAPSLSPLLPN